MHVSYEFKSVIRSNVRNIRLHVKEQKGHFKCMHDSVGEGQKSLSHISLRSRKLMKSISVFMYGYSLSCFF